MKFDYAELAGPDGTATTDPLTAVDAWQRQQVDRARRWLADRAGTPDVHERAAAILAAKPWHGYVWQQLGIRGTYPGMYGTEVNCRACSHTYRVGPGEDYYDATGTTDGLCDSCVITTGRAEPGWHPPGQPAPPVTAGQAIATAEGGPVGEALTALPAPAPVQIGAGLCGDTGVHAPHEIPAGRCLGYVFPSGRHADTPDGDPADPPGSGPDEPATQVMTAEGPADPPDAPDMIP